MGAFALAHHSGNIQPCLLKQHFTKKRCFLLAGIVDPGVDKFRLTVIKPKLDNVITD